MGRPAAFFDVDHTLVAVASMFALLEHEVVTGRRTGDDYERTMGDLRAMKAAGAPRHEVNRAYYRAFAGREQAAVAASGRDWFAGARERGDLFRPAVLARLRVHAAAGHPVVLVSGSFPPCLDPLVEFLGADLLLCSRPQVCDGVYTGELAEPMVGGRKAAAVAAAGAARGLALAECYAYGDHCSDLPFLAGVGHPVVVGCDPVLRDHAARHRWECLEP